MKWFPIQMHVGKYKNDKKQSEYTQEHYGKSPTVTRQKTSSIFIYFLVKKKRTIPEDDLKNCRLCYN